MKTALYIADGVTQVVMTPQTETDKRVCEQIESIAKGSVRVFRGSFYECGGGWVRFDNSERYLNDWQTDDRSLILRADERRDPVPP